MTGRRPLAVSILVVVAAVLTGCAAPVTAGWEPPSADSPQMAVTTVSAVAPAKSGGIDVRLLYSAAEGSPSALRWAEIPGAAALNDALRGRARQALDAHAGVSGVAYVPRADAPKLGADQRGCIDGSTTRPAAELLADPVMAPQTSGPIVVMTCEIRAAVGSVLVQTLRTVTAKDGGVTSDSAETVYADSANGVVMSGRDLIDTSAHTELLTDVVSSLRIEAGAFQDAPQEDFAEWDNARFGSAVTDIALEADGSLDVTLAAGFTLPELEDLGRAPAEAPLIMRMAPEHADGVLSANGRGMRAVLSSGAAFAPPTAPWRGQEDIDCSLFACLALTFDDGPSVHTAGILDELKARRAAATFFVQGVNVVNFPELVKRESDEGHQIGNHTWNHPDLTTKSDEEIRGQMGRDDAAIKNAGVAAPKTFRPPYGAYDDRVLAAVGRPAVLWSVDTLDWQQPDDATYLSRAIDQPKPGGIVLMHDIQAVTARLVPQILDGTLSRGFTLVTVDQVVAGTSAAKARVIKSRG